MTTHRRPPRRWPRRVVLGLTVLALMAVTTPALATTPELDQRSPAAGGSTITSRTDATRAAATTTRLTGPDRSRTASDHALARPDELEEPPGGPIPGINVCDELCDGTGGPGTWPPPPPPRYCLPEINYSAIRLAAAGQVGFSGKLTCQGFSPQITAITALIDRTSGRDGRYLSPELFNTGTADVRTPSYTAVLPDNNYPEGLEAEVQLQVAVTSPGALWACNALPSGLRYLRSCQVSGDTVIAWIGTGKFATKVQHPAEECREDHNPTVFSGATYTVTVTPHIRYCGYFNNGTTGRVTRVEKLRPTGLTASGILACNLAFFPDPANDGVFFPSGLDWKFEVQVRLQLGICDLAGTGIFRTAQRTYLRTGDVQRSP